jgi:uncharacterized protein YbaA (DUF1428 family)
MAHYVDGFVVPVPRARVDDYRRLARKAARLYLGHGALSVTECLADDVKPGKLTSFPQAVKLKDDETVVFSWIVYKSRKDRDRITKAVMADPAFEALGDPKDLPFDGKRMFWGGFKTIVEA